MPEIKDLSIIIPQRNTKLILNDCLRSIFQETKKVNFEVIVVDNASSDGSTAMVREKYPDVKIITNSNNLGYGRANNQALKSAKGNYILFLNSDTVILEDAIGKSINFVRQNKQAEILGCQLVNPDGSIQPSAGFFPKLRQVLAWMLFLDNLPLVDKIIKPYQQTKTYFYKKIEVCDWVTGAFLLVNKKVIDKIVGFDEGYLMYSEEVDFCYRAKKAGFRVWFYPQAKIIHYKGKSSVNSFETAILGEYQGIKRFYQKYKPDWEQPILKVLLKLGAILRVIIFGILRQEVKKKTYEKAYRLV